MTPKWTVKLKDGMSGPAPDAAKAVGKLSKALQRLTGMTNTKLYTKSAGSSPDAFRGWLEAQGASFDPSHLDAFLDAHWEDDEDQVFALTQYGGVGKSGKTLNSQAFLRVASACDMRQQAIAQQAREAEERGKPMLIGGRDEET